MKKKKQKNFTHGVAANGTTYQWIKVFWFIFSKKNRFPARLIPSRDRYQTLISSSALPPCSGTKNHTPTAISAINTGIVMNEA